MSTVLLGWHPESIFIEGNYLALFGNKYVPTVGRVTLIRIYDIENRSNPVLLQENFVEGRYFSGRKTPDGFIYLVSIKNFQRRLPSYTFA